MALFYNYIYLKQLSNHNTGSAETFCLRKKRRQRLNRTLKYINIYFPTADINLGFRQHFTSVSSKYLKSFSFRLPAVPRPVFCPRTTPLLCVLHSQTALYWQMAFDDMSFPNQPKVHHSDVGRWFQIITKCINIYKYQRCDVVPADERCVCYCWAHVSGQQGCNWINHSIDEDL